MGKKQLKMLIVVVSGVRLEVKIFPSLKFTFNNRDSYNSGSLCSLSFLPKSIAKVKGKIVWPLPTNSPGRTSLTTGASVITWDHTWSSPGNQVGVCGVTNPRPRGPSHEGPPEERATCPQMLEHQAHSDRKELRIPPSL